MFLFWFNTFFIDWHVMQQDAQQAIETKSVNSTSLVYIV